MIVAAHHSDQPTCKLGIAASTFTSGGGWSGGVTVPKMWFCTRVSMMPGTTNRGGATGSNQKTASAAMLEPTRAERQRPYTSGRRHHNSNSTVVVMA
jgi:hypothetical protein